MAVSVIFVAQTLVALKKGAKLALSASLIWIRGLSAYLFAWLD